MPKIPQFRQEDPTFKPQKVASEAPGFEAAAKALGQAGEIAQKGAERLESFESNHNYSDALAEINKIKRDSHTKMRMNPTSASQVHKHAQDKINNALSSVKLNNKDRNRLNNEAKLTENELKNKSHFYEYKLNKKMVKANHYDTWSHNLQSLQEDFREGRFEEAENKQEGFEKNLKGLLANGVISPHEYHNSIKQIESLVENAHQYRQLFVNKKATAYDYNQTKADTLGPHDQDLTDDPINETTNWRSAESLNSKNFHDALARVQQGLRPKMGSFLNMTDSEREHIALVKKGVSNALGYINEHAPLSVMKMRAKQLESLPGTGTYVEKSEKQYLNQYIKNIENGNWQETIANTPEGQRINENYAHNLEAIIQDEAMSDDFKSIMIADKKNEYADEMRSLAEAQDIPQHLVDPIPMQDQVKSQQAFSQNGDPQQLLESMQWYSKPNQKHLANRLEKPTQSIVASVISDASGDISQSNARALITANKDGMKFNNLMYYDRNQNPDGPRSGDLKAKAATNLDNVLNYVTRAHDPDSSSQLQHSLVTATTQLAKYYATQNNDEKLEDWEQYVDRASQQVKKAYDVRQGDGWIVNMKGLQGEELDDSSLSQLSWYMKKQFKEEELMDKQGKTDAQATMQLERDPLEMVITPDNVVQLKNRNGDVYKHEPYNPHLLELADHEMRQNPLSFVDQSNPNDLDKPNFVRDWIYGKGLSAVGFDEADKEVRAQERAGVEEVGASLATGMDDLYQDIRDKL